ncbi:MAG: S24/S26 family peptidase [Pseudomonadota bacterium]
MKSRNLDHSFSDAPAAELSLPGPAFVDLLQTVLEKGMRFRFQASGFSMSPFIKNGDVVTVYPLAECSPVIGDVVAFIRQNAGKLVVHRLVREKNGSYLIHGDNTPGSDGLVGKSNILGCVKQVERNGKKVLMGLGPEKYLIAFLSRAGVLPPLLALMRRLAQVLFRFNR